MFQDEEICCVIRELEDILSGLNIVHYFTGGIIVSFYSEPRFTQDIDLVVVLSKDQITALVNRLENRFFVDSRCVLSEFGVSEMFQAIHRETAMKVDFHLGELIQGELQRVTKQELYPKVFAPIKSRVDVILSKLNWIMRCSHKSRQDV